MWKTASLCVLLGNESKKAPATEHIFKVVFSVLPKFYEEMSNRPSQISIQLKN